ncbi:MAG: hypothetical protein Q8R04_05395 [Nanoarchaeota archaeon]|nr:hypothetical protein [Nanoarchaeota archaeon]
MVISISDIPNMFSKFAQNLPGGDYLKIGISIVGVAIIGFVVVELARRSGRATWGYGYRSLEREEGLGGVSRSQRQIEALERRARDAERKLAAAEKSEEAQAKDKSTIEADAAVEEGAKAAAHEEAAEFAAAAVEARSIDIEATLKKIYRAIRDYAYQKRGVVLSEEQIGKIIEGIWEDIGRFDDYGKIDERIGQYLVWFHRKLVAALQNQVETERQSEGLMENLVKKLEDAVSKMRTAIGDARRELKKLRREGKKTKKHFRTQLSDLRASFKAKRKELQKLEGTADANPQVIASLQSEINLRSQQLASAKTVNSQLEATYSFMKRATSQMKRLLRYVLANEQQIKGYDKVLKNRKKQADSRFESLRQVVHSIERVPEDPRTQNPHGFALVLSSRMKPYFEMYIGILEEDLSFDSTVKDITIKDFVISQQMQAFQQIQIALTQSNEAIKSGIGALLELTNPLLGKGSQVNAEEIVKILRGATQTLQFEEGIENWMSNLARALKIRSRGLSATVQAIIDEGKRLLDQTKLEEERSSSHIGNVMATMMQRKIDINRSQGMAQATEFAQQVEQQNAKVARTFNQALNLERAATPA